MTSRVSVNEALRSPTRSWRERLRACLNGARLTLVDRRCYSIIVLSYGSNGYPDRETIENILGRYNQSVTTYERPHRYYFGTHEHMERAAVNEYLIVGR